MSLPACLREIPSRLSICPRLTGCWADARLQTAPGEKSGRWGAQICLFTSYTPVVDWYSGDTIAFFMTMWSHNNIELFSRGFLEVTSKQRRKPSCSLLWFLQNLLIISCVDLNVKKIDLYLFSDLLYLTHNTKDYLLWNTLGNSSGSAVLHISPAVHSAATFLLTQGI